MELALNYIRIARPDHWFKNILMLPGVFFAVLFTNKFPENFLPLLFIGFFSTCFVTSANYVINEWLDKDFDAYHPTKNSRPSVSGKVKGGFVYLEYCILAALGLGLATLVSEHFLIFSGLLLLMGIVYNVPPLRSKEKIYIDVLSESLNNPIRFLLGWSIAEFAYLPPSSILLAYWMAGAFLMGVKRFAEYRSINDPLTAGKYRKSFKRYTEESLLISSFFYALCSSFFLAIFLIKYRIEYIFCFPFLSALFAWYLKIAMQKNSSVQEPEKLYREKTFVIFALSIAFVIIILSFVNIPSLEILVQRVKFD